MKLFKGNDNATERGISMKYRVYLEEEDVIKIIADRFDAREEDVELEFKQIEVGHGEEKRTETILKAEVTSDDPLD